MLLKRYYKWERDCKTSTLDAKKGEIYTHFQAMGSCITLLDIQPISPWLRPISVQDMNGHDLFEHDLVRVSNRKTLIIGWSEKEMGWRLCGKLEGGNLDPNLHHYRIEPEFIEFTGSIYF